MPSCAANHANILGIVRIRACLNEVMIRWTVLRMRGPITGRITLHKVIFIRLIAETFDYFPTWPPFTGFQYRDRFARFGQFIRY